MPASSKGGANEPARMSAKELKAEAQKLNRLALDTLGKIMRGRGQDSVRLAAAREILDRAHGKPKAAATKAKAAKPKADPGLTVVIKRFTDAPDLEAGEYEERS